MNEPDAPPQRKLWTELTWSDLERWAGSRSVQRGRSYQKRGAVQCLAYTGEGVLMGRVLGGEVYTTRVTQGGAYAGAVLSATCSCPVGANCKHAVALVVEYLDLLKAGNSVPAELPPRTRDEYDLEGDDDEDNWEGEDDFDEHEDDDEGGEDDDDLEPVAVRSPAKRKGGAVADYLASLPHEELVAMILDVAASDTQMRATLEARASLNSGEVGKVLRSLRAEVRRVSSEPGWRRHWSGEGFTPNYGLVVQHLRSLLAAGQADTILEVGCEILRLGVKQVEMSDDEGDTAIEIATALAPVWEALGSSSLSPAERILWAYDRYDEDDYELCSGSDDAGIWEVSPAVWNELADVLVARLGEVAIPKDAHDWHGRYARDGHAGRAIGALEHAGRSDEAIELSLQEAAITGSYERAVRMLLAAGRADEARTFALEGIAKTQETAPGIASQLRKTIRGLAAQDGDATLVAAFLAEDFLVRPDLSGYRALRGASEQAGLWPAVRDGVLAALASGTLPSADSGWPLPPTDVGPTRATAAVGRSHPELVIEIALDEGDLAWTMGLYREYTGDKRARPNWGGSISERVAAAVASDYPDESIAIWRGLAEAEIDRGNRGAYESSLRYLDPMRRLLIDLERGAEWSTYLAELPTQNQRRRALLETLDKLEDRPIVEG